MRGTLLALVAALAALLCLGSAIASAAPARRRVRPAAAAKREAARGGFATGRVVVGYAPGRTNAVEARAGSSQERTEVLTLRPGESVRGALRRLRRERGVSFAVPDYVAHVASVGGGAGRGARRRSGAQRGARGHGRNGTRHRAHGRRVAGHAASAGYVPNDPGKSGQPGGWEKVQWNFAGEYGVGAPVAWENLIADGAPGGSGTVVAVLDTGVAYENRGRYLRSPDFEGSQFVPGYDFVGRTSHPDDQNGHGTFVAGTIAEATNNGIGLTGLAYGAKIMPVRVLDARGEGDASTIAKGVRWAVNHGANVINMSLVFSASVTAAEIPELTSALAYAHAHGVVVVAAAGNKASTTVPYPAHDKFVISVGASTEHGCVASYSNYGSEVDIVAPGGGTNARLPDDPNCSAVGSGADVFQETFLGPSPRVFGLPGGYEGTSMATPDVSAAAALVIASGVLGPHPTPAAVRYRLEQTATPLGGTAYPEAFGHGLLNAAAATAPGGPGAVSAGSAARAQGGGTGSGGTGGAQAATASRHAKSRALRG